MAHSPASKVWQDATELILRELETGVLHLPTGIALTRIASRVGSTPQVVGMAYADYIAKPLLAKGIASRKCGTPRSIELEHVK